MKDTLDSPVTLVQAQPGTFTLTVVNEQPGALPYPDPNEWMGYLNSPERRFREAEDACLRRLEKYLEAAGSLSIEEREDFMKKCMEEFGISDY